MSLTIEQDLKEYLGQHFESFERRFQSFERRFESFEQKFEKIDQKLEKMDDRLKNLEIGQVEVKGDIKALDEKFNGLKGQVGKIEQDLKEVKGSQAAQIWTLIGVLGTAVVGTVIRFVITALPGNP